MNILYSVNNDYVPVLMVSLKSLFESNQDNELYVTVLTNGIDDISIVKLNELALKYGMQLNIVDASSLNIFFEQFKGIKWRGDYTANYRLFFNHFLNVEENILYLDADTIIINDIADLMAIDLSDNYVGMVKEPQGYDYKAMIGMADDDYFNSGVMLINSKKWKDDNCDMKIVECLRNNEYFLYPDQDILNRAFKDKIKILDPKYNHMTIHRVCDINCYNSVYGFENYYEISKIVESLEVPVIMHCHSFLGELAWDFNGFHPDIDIYRNFSDMIHINNLKYNKYKFNVRMLRKLRHILPPNFFWKIYRKSSIKYLNKKVAEIMKDR